MQNFADACEERARRCPPNGNGRSLYHVLANEARLLMAARLGDRELAGALVAISAVAETAAAYWLGGEPSPYAPPAPLPLAAAPPPPSRAPGALNARQIASRSGMTDRWARELIRRGVAQGRPGFSRAGSRWFVEPSAFAEFRISSE